MGELIFSADVSSESTFHIDHGAKGTLVFVGLQILYLQKSSNNTGRYV